MLLHDLDRFGDDAFALSDRFAGFEGEGRIHALVDQIHRDIVSGRDDVVQRRGSGLDQVGGVAHPDVGAVGQTGNAHQTVKVVRLGVDQHLPGELPFLSER